MTVNNVISVILRYFGYHTKGVRFQRQMRQTVKARPTLSAIEM